MTDHHPPDDPAPDDHAPSNVAPDGIAPDEAELDLALRRRLRDGVTTPDPAVELGILRPRFVHARRRRRARVAALSSAAAVLLAVAGVSLAGGRDTQVITPATGHTSAPSTTQTAETTSPPATTTSVVPDTTMPTAASGASTTAPAGSPTSTIGAAPATTTVPPRQTPLTVAGGTVVVRSDATTVGIVSVTPATGWIVAERKTEPTRIEVRFERVGSSDQARVVARVEHGQLRTDLS
jgi:hypothetical protein